MLADALACETDRVGDLLVVAGGEVGLAWYCSMRKCDEGVVHDAPGESPIG